MRPVQFTLHDQWSVIRPPSSSCAHYARTSSGGGLFQSTSPQECPSTSLCWTYACSPTPPVRAGGAHLSHQTGGLWDSVQKCPHINVLELLAVRLALQHFLPLVQGQPVMVMTNNTTVVAQLRNQGGTLKAPFIATLPSCCSGPTVTTSA